MTPLTQQELVEALKLINELQEMSTGPDLKDELDDLLDLVDDQDIAWMDLRYLRALKKRLT